MNKEDLNQLLIVGITPYFLDKEAFVVRLFASLRSSRLRASAHSFKTLCFE